MTALGVPEAIVNSGSLIQALNQTPLVAFPQEVQSLIQRLVSVAYVTVGGFFGIFVLSVMLKWWQGHQLKKRYELILEKLDKIEKKLSRK